MARIQLRVRNPKATPQREALYQVLQVKNSGASPRGSTYYKTFQSCPRQFYIKYVLRWVPAIPSDALTIGLVWHYCLERYYRAIMLHQQKSKPRPNDPAWLWGGCNEGARQAYDLLDQLAAAFGYKEISGIVRKMLDHYLDAHDRRDRLRILAVEETLAYWGDDPYTCRADMIVEDYDRGGMWFWEHKSAHGLTDDLLSAYDMDLQVLGEWWLLSVVIDKDSYPPLRGVIINIQTKPKTDTSDTALKSHRHEVCPSAAHIRGFNNTIGTRKIMLEAAEQAGWPMYFGNCAGAARGYSKCEFYDLCHDFPDSDAKQLAAAGIERFPNYVESEAPDGEEGV